MLDRMKTFIRRCNRWGARGVPFFFLVDFEKERPLALTLEECRSRGIRFSVPRMNPDLPLSEPPPSGIPRALPPLKRKGVNRRRYHEGFSLVQYHLRRGDTYLLNLTYPTELMPPRGAGPEGEPAGSGAGGEPLLAAFYEQTSAPYKLYVPGKFVLFSPEGFVRLEKNTITTYPMKGTRQGTRESDGEALLSDKKETFEHNTVVDLLRNDLSQAARNVRVSRFRYLEEIQTREGPFLQTSSAIEGDLPEMWRHQVGTLLDLLLPAGSVSGAPKKKTCQIIARAEGEPRGYYTGVFGFFDGSSLESGVNIRYIEPHAQGGRLQFRSGGGITLFSREEEEYQELLRKTRFPLEGGFSAEGLPLVETLSLKRGKIENLSWHQARLERAFRELWGVPKAPWDLAPILRKKQEAGDLPFQDGAGQWKVRFLYGRECCRVEVAFYEAFHPQTLQMVEADDLDYSHKYTDRESLKLLHEKRGEADDILILRRGEVTDTFSANICFFDGERWITPARPLLPGTTRERLLAAGILREKVIRRGDLASFSGWTLINAMIGFAPGEPGRLRPLSAIW